jgi:hypothetical protein
MAYSVQTVLTDLSGVIHGTTTNKIPNVYGILNRAARAVLLDVDPKETTKIVQLSQVFNDVFDYPLPVDVKGDRIVDLRPQAGRNPGEVWTQGYETEFDSQKYLGVNNRIYTQWNTGVKSIRIEAPTLTSPVTLCDTSTIQGWTASSGATALSLDQTNNVAGGGALVFNLSAGQSIGVINNTTLQAIDYSSYAQIATGFVWVYLPSGSAMTSIQAIWGSDTTSNFYSSVVNMTQQGYSFQDGWNLLSFPWVSATVTGTPNNAQINSLKMVFHYNGALQTGIQVCNFTFALGYIFELVYYSKYLFRNPLTNAFQETVNSALDNSMLINLDTESYNLFFNKVAFFTAQSLQGADAEYDAQYWATEYTNALTRYKAMNPSEAMVKGSVYYQVPKKGYGSGWNGFIGNIPTGQ